MTQQTDRKSYHFPDGSKVELTAEADSPAVLRIFGADLAKRMRRVRLVVVQESATLSGFGSCVPDARVDARRSRTTHALPQGKVTVSIDASGKGIHGYLYHLVTAAVAYTRAVTLDEGRATMLSAASFAGGAVLLATGYGALSLPLFCLGLVFGLYLCLYWLSARGLVPSLSRAPIPGSDRP